MVALRRAAGAPGGATGAVLEADGRRGTLTVGWAAGTAVLSREEAAHVGFGFAVTPTLAAATAGPLIVLGPPDAVGRERSRVVHHALARDGPEAGRALVL